MSGNQPTSEAYEAAIKALTTFAESLRQNAQLMGKTDALLEGNLTAVRQANGIHAQTGDLVQQLNQQAQAMEELAQRLKARLQELEQM